MSSEFNPEAFDKLVDAEYPVVQDAQNGINDYFEEELSIHSDLVELREHIRTKLRQSDYFSWRGGDEIEAFVEGFTAATILLRRSVDTESTD